MIVKNNGRIMKKHYTFFSYKGKQCRNGKHFVAHINKVDCLHCLRNLSPTSRWAKEIMQTEKLKRELQRAKVIAA